MTPEEEKAYIDEGMNVLHIETDYSQEDAGQLKTRVEAFVEILNNKLKCYGLRASHSSSVAGPIWFSSIMSQRPSFFRSKASKAT